MSAAALAGGVVMASFNGVGSALEAVNKYRLAPTAENFAAVREEMSGLSKEARQGVRALADLRPLLIGIRDAGAAGFFPGFVEGLDHFEELAPVLERIFNTVGGAAGGLFEGALDELASEEWAPFLEFVETSAPAALTSLGQTVGNLTKGVAELFKAMSPLSSDFSGGLLQASERFEAWAEGVAQTEGYREFIDYVRETGPQVVETVGSLADAVLQIGEAAAPLGGPILQGLELVADTISTIADSPVGPPIMAAVTAMSALSLATTAWGKVSATAWMTAARGANGYVAQLSAVRASMGGLGKGAAVVGGMTLATSDLGESMGITNTAMFATMGLMAGPWGAAVGAGVGLTMDFVAATKEASAGTRDWITQIEAAGGNIGQLQALIDEMRATAAAGTGDGGPFDFLTDSDAEDAANGLKVADARMRELAEAQGFASAGAYEHAEALRTVAAASVSATNSALGYEGALRSMREATSGVTGAFTKNGQVQHGLTEEQQRAATTLLATGEAWGSLTAAQRRAAGGTKTARAEFVKTAMQLGMDKTAANGYADALYRIPAKRKTKIELEADAAMATLRAFRDFYLPPKKQTIITSVVPGGGINLDPTNPNTTLGNADGGFYPRMFANGGMDRANAHQPEIAPAGAWRVWAEPETGGEAYIPLANDHRRPRARSIAEQTVAEMGGNVEWFATGGRRGGGDMDGIRELGKAAREAAKAMREETKSRLEAVRSERAALRESLAGRFRSNIFEAPDNPWGADGVNVTSRLTADIGQARQANAAAVRLKKLGLDGAALGDLLQNADLATINAMSRGPRAQVQQYEQLYKIRERETARFGKSGANAAYAGQINAITRELRALRRDVQRTGRDVGREINNSAASGRRGR
jgi:hypothetical protein